MYLLHFSSWSYSIKLQAWCFGGCYLQLTVFGQNYLDDSWWYSDHGSVSSGCSAYVAHFWISVLIQLKLYQCSETFKSCYILSKAVCRSMKTACVTRSYQTEKHYQIPLAVWRLVVFNTVRLLSSLQDTRNIRELQTNTNSWPSDLVAVYFFWPYLRV